MFIAIETACVERFVRIESNPAGAEILVNGRSVGQAPVEQSFTHYGIVRVDAWHEDRPGVTRFVELETPWYEQFPIDLVFELLDPFTHVDRHDVLIEIPPSPPIESRDELLRRADELRQSTR